MFAQYAARTMFAGFNEPYEKFIKFDSNDRKMYELLALLHCINIKKGEPRKKSFDIRLHCESQSI